MNKKILCIASLLLLFIGHISAVDHLWEFNEGSGNIAYDSKGGRRGRDAVNGVLNNAQWIVVDDGYGVQITGADNSYVSFANPIGQFGTQDFTVAFWLQTTDRSLALADLVGNRAAPGHGNFFAVRMTNDGYVSAEVDQDAAGTNYIGFRSTQNGLNDGRWHHVAVVRSGRTLTLYIDGAASNSGTGAGVANINNGVVFKIGRSLVDPGTPRFAPRALFDDLATYDSALSASDIAELAGGQPQPQPRSQDHLWEFDEGRGNIAYDSEGGRNPVNGVLNNAQWKEVDDGYGVQITGADNSYVSFANPIGQFGTQDFTVAFWFQTNDKSLSLADLVGNRAAPGHGSFFAVRMTNDGYVSAEVDQDAAGTNYIGLRSNRNRLNDGRWHHVAVVRSGRNLVLYIDGLPSNSGNSAGVANINNGLVFKIGRSLVDPNTPRFAPKALFDDLATYNSALSANDIADLAGVDLDSRDHLWVFDEGSGNIAYDSEGGRNPVNGVLNNAQWVVVDDGYGVQITGADNSYVSFANPIGQFGTRDFTVAFWFQTNDKSLALADLVGNRAAPGHGNFFAVRMTNDGYVSAEVDQDTAGTNYIGLRSTQNKLNDGNWHHVAVVRSGRTLTLYVDGYASNSGNSAGVANINNGLVFKIGRSLVDRNTPRFAPKALFDDLATYDSALSAEDIAEIVGVDPDPKPQGQNHLWTFDEGTGNTARDSAGGRNAVNGVLNNAQWIDLSKVGPGAAVRITGADNSYVSFANPIGQFGTQDFTVAFWFQTTDNSLPVVDLVGNRAAPGHGNFFSTRLSNDGYVSAEVDQDGAGTNYIGFRSTQKGLNDGNWHQVVVTRSGRTLTLYIDGAASNSGTAGGVANINNNVVFKIGRSLVDRNTARFAPDATFDDLATYNYALNANQVNQLYQSATNQ